MLSAFTDFDGLYIEGPRFHVFETILIMCVNTAIDATSGLSFPQILWQRNGRRYFQVYEERDMSDFFKEGKGFDRVMAELALHGIKLATPVNVTSEVRPITSIVAEPQLKTQCELNLVDEKNSVRRYSIINIWSKFFKEKQGGKFTLIPTQDRVNLLSKENGTLKHLSMVKNDGVEISVIDAGYTNLGKIYIDKEMLEGVKLKDNKGFYGAYAITSVTTIEKQDGLDPIDLVLII